MSRIDDLNGKQTSISNEIESITKKHTHLHNRWAKQKREWNKIWLSIKLYSRYSCECVKFIADTGKYSKLIILKILEKKNTNWLEWMAWNNKIAHSIERLQPNDAVMLSSKVINVENSRSKILSIRAKRSELSSVFNIKSDLFGWIATYSTQTGCNDIVTGVFSPPIRWVIDMCCLIVIPKHRNDNHFPITQYAMC